MDDQTRNTMNKHLARLIGIERLLRDKGIVTKEELKAYRAEAEMDLANSLKEARRWDDDETQAY